MSKSKTTDKYTMKKMKYLFTILIVISSNIIFAQEISVVDVRRNITLHDDDNVYRDYYLNAGDGSALRKNMVVKVKRKVLVKESPTKNIGDFETTVGLLKIIHIGNKVSVAREFKLLSRDEEPMLEQIGIMSGDKIDTAGSYIDYSKPNYKHKSSEAEPKNDDTIKTATNTIQKTESTENNNNSRNPASVEPSLLQKIIPMPGI